MEEIRGIERETENGANLLHTTITFKTLQQQKISQSRVRTEAKPTFLNALSF